VTFGPTTSFSDKNRDNFIIPLIAALSDARHDEQVRSALQDRKNHLVELTSESGDPSCPSASTSEGLGTILREIKSNIDRRQQGLAGIRPINHACRRGFGRVSRSQRCIARACMQT